MSASTLGGMIEEGGLGRGRRSWSHGFNDEEWAE